MLLPIRPREVLSNIRDALRFKLSHDDLTRYNAVQKMLYVGIIVVVIVQVLSGLAIWKPVQFSELAALFCDFQGARLVHFLGMAAIVGFVLVHVALALLVPQTLIGMITGGPQRAMRSAIASSKRPRRKTRIDQGADACPIRTPSPSIFRPKAGIDQSVLQENKELLAEIDRRKILRGAVSLGALTMLTGCDVTNRRRRAERCCRRCRRSTTACRR